MTLIADILLAAGALGAAFYCFILGRRLRNFNNLEKGMGGAVAVLSAQVDDLEKTLTTAQAAATKSAQDLRRLAERAEDVRRQLELQIASVHDIVPDPQTEALRPEQPAPKHETETEPGELMFSRRRIKEAS